MKHAHLARGLVSAVVLSFAQLAAAAGPTRPVPPVDAVESVLLIRKSGVSLAYTVEGTGKPGTEVVVRLNFQPPRAPRGATIRYTLEGPATRLAADANPVLPGQAASRVVRIRIDGNQAPTYLHVHTAQGGRTDVMSIALPQAGPQPKLGQPAAARTLPAEPPLVVLPGQLR